IRNFIIPVTKFGSNLGIPLAIFGLIFNYRPLLYVGIILYSAVALFQLLTLPVELNASKRALNTISQNGFLIGAEYNGAKKVLTAAALTYVAALASSLATLLRLILISERRR
uniref:zinc metallopeptidase n=1 Tax=Eubacterium sp. TaxID=142586 RepID=UPI003FEE7AAE